MDKTEKPKPEEVNFGYEAERTELEEENKILKETVEHLKDELNRLRSAPLIVAEVKELVNDHAIVRLTNGNEFYVNILKECPKIKPGDFVLCEQKNLTIIDLASTSKSYNVEKFVLIDKLTDPPTIFKLPPDPIEFVNGNKLNPYIGEVFCVASVLNPTKFLSCQYFKTPVFWS